MRQNLTKFLSKSAVDEGVLKSNRYNVSSVKFSPPNFSPKKGHKFTYIIAKALANSKRSLSLMKEAK